MSWGGGFAPYVPVAQKKRQAEQAIAKMRKKGSIVEPVIIHGKHIATTWWGISWCENLEKYADYENRIERGRTYVRNGFVLDLSISQCIVDAVVMGSSKYKIRIKIDKINEDKWRGICQKASRSLGSLAQLTNGQFPKNLEDVFLRQGTGLFPTPDEIDFDCSCPDGAYMCKHVAAVLYGIGARLDQDPLLFFKLRGVDANALLRDSMQEKLTSILRNAGNKTTRVIDDCDVDKLFELG